MRLIILKTIMIFYSCQNNDEESGFLTFKNKISLMLENWVVDKVYGSGKEFADSFSYNMPDFTCKLTYIQDRDSYYYSFIDNIKIVYFGPFVNGTKYIEIPILTKSKTGSLVNDMPITYKAFSNVYTVESIDKTKITLYENKYHKII